MLPCHTQIDQAGVNTWLGCRYAMRARQVNTFRCSIYHLLTSKSPDEVCRKLSWALLRVDSPARNLERAPTFRASQHAPLARSVSGTWKRARSEVPNCRHTSMARTGGKRHLNEADALPDRWSGRWWCDWCHHGRAREVRRAAHSHDVVDELAALGRAAGVGAAATDHIGGDSESCPNLGHIYYLKMSLW